MKEEKITLDGKEYILKPLDWKHYPKLFTLMSKFEGVDDKNFMSALDEKTMESLMDLELHTFKLSHPEIREDELKQIVMHNIFEILPVMVELNFNKK